MRAKGRVAVAACMKEGGKNRWRDEATLYICENGYVLMFCCSIKALTTGWMYAAV